MLRGILAAIAVLAALTACDQIGAPADPLADARQTCANATVEPAARKTACDALLASDALTEQGRRDALAHRGDAQAAQGDPTAALRDYSAALEMDDTFAEAKLGRASVLLASGQLDAAAPLIESVIEQGALPGRAHYLRGDLYARSGNRTGAITEFDAAIAADSHLAGAFAQRGLARQADANYADARRDFDAAIRLDRANAPALAGRCWNEILRDGANGPAQGDAEDAVAADPGLMNAQLCLGLALLRQQKWSEARIAYEAALRIEPASAAALFGRGVARRELGENDEGRADIRRAYEFNSDIDEDFERLGVDF